MPPCSSPLQIGTRVRSRGARSFPASPGGKTSPNQPRPTSGTLFTSSAAVAGAPDGCGFLPKEQVDETAQLLGSIELVLADNAARIRQDRDPSRL